MRATLRLLAVLLPVAFPGSVSAGHADLLLGSPPTFSEPQFRRSCSEARGYEEAQCDCALRGLRRNFDHEDRPIALLYLQLAMIAENDVEALTHWLGDDDSSCPPQARTPVVEEIYSRHRAPGYLYGTLRLIRISPDRFKNWERRDEILEIRHRCLPVPEAVLRKAGRIEDCIEQALKIKNCSRCHDYRGIDLTK